MLLYSTCSIFSSALLVLPPRHRDYLMGDTADLDLATIARCLIAVTAPPGLIGWALRIQPPVSLLQVLVAQFPALRLLNCTYFV